MGTSVIWDKIRLAKEKGNNEEVINSLQDIINDLIWEKNDLKQIAQVYDEQLVSQKISEEDINYITEHLIPVIKELLETSSEEDGNAEKLQETITAVEALITKDTINMMQILGFNFKKAIGEPLTDLTNKLITSNIPVTNHANVELNILSRKLELEMIDLAKDEESFERYRRIKGL